MNGIGERLKLARTKARMSQRALADQAGVTAMSISKYENNEMMPGSDVLLKLADALDVRMEFFLRSAPELAIQPVYRKHSRMGQKAQEAVKAQIQDWLERYLLIESFYPGDVCVKMPEGYPRQVETLEDTEEIANALRAAWQLGDNPIDNLMELLEEKGIKVGLVKGDDDFDACTFLYDGETPAIAANENRPSDRQRFSLAHELGHIMMQVAKEVDEEKAAHRFAGAFLVPADAALMELGTVRRYLDPFELMMLKEKYGMSMAAWIHRAKELGILSESAADRMRQWFNGRGWRKREPTELPQEKPRRMHRLVRRLVAEEVISESRAAELMGERIVLSLDRYEEAFAVHH
jgi:Zn-dependent peptidase ImmA (M78 family)/DNA-binding XRE family transcriptional regulator